MSEPGAPSDAQRLRPIMPAQATRPPVKRPSPLPGIRANNLIAAACGQCRKRKVKCSGDRPACRYCVRHRYDCSYSTQPGETEAQALTRRYRDLQSRATALEELLDLLKTLPDRDAQAVLQRVRSRDDVETIVNHVRAGDLLVQMAVVPETRYRYQLPYRSEMPAVYLPNNAYLESLIFEGASLRLRSTSLGSSKPATARHPSDKILDSLQCLYLQPFHAAKVIDPLVARAKLTAWTSVCNDNALLQNLLLTFMRCEYQLTAAFHKDFFLEDLIAHRHEFCSSLLVNVILGYACAGYPQFTDRAQYWNPNTLQYRFIAEAKRLWELEATQPRVTIIQAGILLNVVYSFCGLDAVGHAYRVHAIGLANKIRLFERTEEGSERSRAGRAYTAWALFNYDTITSFCCVAAPTVRKPPDWPLPDPSKNSSWYGEVMLKYPLSNEPIPSHFGHTVKASSELRVMMNEFSQKAFLNGPDMTPSDANNLLARLQNWYNSLSSSLKPNRIVLPAQIHIHMWYHHFLLAIYRPLLNNPTTQVLTLHEIIADADKHLQTLIRLYYLRHGYEALDVFLVIPLMIAGSDALEAVDQQPPYESSSPPTPSPELETLRSTLMLVAKGLYDQRRNHYLAEALFRVVRGRMRPAEVALLRGTMTLMDEGLEEKRKMAQEIRSQWAVTVMRETRDREEKNLRTLVENYAHLNAGEDDTAAEGLSDGDGQVDGEVDGQVDGEVDGEEDDDEDDDNSNEDYGDEARPSILDATSRRAMPLERSGRGISSQ